MTPAMEPWVLDDSTVLSPLGEADVEPMHRLLTANREHLDAWLRWSAQLQTLDQVRGFIREFQERQARGDGFHLGIRVNGELVGGLVCWYIQRQNRNCEIGYWLGTPFTGRGLASRAAARAVRHLFTVEGLHRIEMQCAVENLRSRAVPERLGFSAEGIRRDSHWIGTRFQNHVVYGLLRNEWDEAAGH